MLSPSTKLAFAQLRMQVSHTHANGKRLHAFMYCNRPISIARQWFARFMRKCALSWKSKEILIPNNHKEASTASFYEHCRLLLCMCTVWHVFSQQISFNLLVLMYLGIENEFDI